MSQIYTPVIRALVVGTLLAATAAVLHVTVQTARAAGAPPRPSFIRFSPSAGMTTSKPTKSIPTRA